MSVVGKVIQIGGKSFTKNGFRLLEKTTTAITPEMHSKGFSKAFSFFDTVKIGDVEGNIQKIISFKDSNGKLLRRVRTCSNSPEVKVTDYTRSNPLMEEVNEVVFARNPNVYTSKTQTSHTVVTNPKGLVSKETRTVDINTQNKAVTVAIGRSEVGGAEVVDTSQITELVDGKKTKEIMSKFKFDSEGVAYLQELKSLGITEKDLQEIISNPYFFAQFKDSQDFIKSVMPLVEKNQQVKIAGGVKVEMFSRTERAKAYYKPNENRIYIDWYTIHSRLRDLFGGTKRKLVEVLNHESRHGYQRKKVRELNLGNLTKSKEIDFAQKCKENFKNYKNGNNCKTEEEYLNQFVEVDARAAEDIEVNKFMSGAEVLCRVFRNATTKSLGT